MNDPKAKAEMKALFEEIKDLLKLLS